MSHDRDVKFCDCGKQLWDGAECNCQKSASDYQVGGNHYQSDYQHWDWAIDIRLGYLESAATKYVTRWDKKNGVQDVQKGIHYLTKAKEAFVEKRLRNWSTVVGANRALAHLAIMNTNRFCESNQLSPLETNFMLAVAGWQNEGDLAVAIGLAEQILRNAVEAAQARAGAGATPAPTTGLKRPQPAKTGAAGRAGGATTQPPASSASTGVGKINHPAPFGYEGDE